MSTENFAKSMQQAEQNLLLQQKLAAAPHKEQTTKAEGLDSMKGELEDSELDAVNGGYWLGMSMKAWVGEELPPGWVEELPGGFVGKSLG